MNNPPNADDYGEVHTHPNGGNPPSAADLLRLGGLASSNSSFDYSFVVTADGTQYVLVVTDDQLLSGFMGINGNFVNPSTNNFDNLSQAGVDYHFALGQTGSKEHALAYALINSGVSVYKQDAVTPPYAAQGFKKLNVSENISGNVVNLAISDCE